jgi:hypothetical protein
MSHKATGTALAIALIFAAGAVQAQAVFIARKALGRVQQMTQQSPSGQVETATVILDVSADTVYAAIRRRVAANPALKTTRVDETRRFVMYTDGQSTGAMQVAVLGDGVSQLLVPTVAGLGVSATPVVVARVLAVCKEVGVECAQAGQ